MINVTVWRIFRDLGSWYWRVKPMVGYGLERMGSAVIPEKGLVLIR